MPLYIPKQIRYSKASMKSLLHRSSQMSNNLNSRRTNVPPCDRWIQKRAEDAKSLYKGLKDFGLRPVLRSMWLQFRGRKDAFRSDSPLLNLPYELLSTVTEELYPVDLISMNYTCRWLRQSIEHPEVLQYRLQRHKSYHSLQQLPGKEYLFALHLEILYRLDRDGMLTPKKAICSGCKTTHDKNMFTLDALKTVNHERLCLGLTSRI